jgi:hypothetical protein
MRNAATPLIPALLAAAALVSGGLAGCVTDPDRDFASELASNRKKWAENRPGQYAYTLQRSCFCPPEHLGPFLVTARGDSVIAARRIEFHPPGGAPETTSVAEDLQDLSVDSAFSHAEGLLTSDMGRKSATFDPRYGFPASVSADEPDWQDAFGGVSITGFLPLEQE